MAKEHPSPWISLTQFSTLQEAEVQADYLLRKGIVCELETQSSSPFFWPFPKAKIHLMVAPEEMMAAELLLQKAPVSDELDRNLNGQQLIMFGAILSVVGILMAIEADGFTLGGSVMMGTLGMALFFKGIVLPQQAPKS
ncbi:MAG: hypothetical protein AAFR61_26110 [Bacteroidota bacterium]